jgi:hypothetical protein
MKETLVNTETDKDVKEFIENVSDGVRKADAKRLLELMNSITGLEPKIWGQSIIAYGKYKYKRKNGKEFEWFNVGFSLGKAHMTVYVMFDLRNESELLSGLGPHKTGAGCLYIKRLEQVDQEILKEVISKSSKWDRE